MKFLLPIIGILLATPAGAQELGPETVLSLPGQCEALSVGSEDLSTICAPEIVQVIYIGGRIELLVSTDGAGGRFLVFGGSRTEGHAAGDTVVQDVDGVIASPDGSGDNTINLAATGQCLHGDAAAGPAQFSCDVTDTAGVQYQFSFRTDGRPPESMID